MCDNVVSVKPTMTKTLAEIAKDFEQLVKEIGACCEIIMDGSKEQTGRNSEFRKCEDLMKIKCFTMELHTEWHNKVECIAGMLRKSWKHWMIKRQTPRRLWDFVLAWIAKTCSRTARLPNNRTGHKQMTGDTLDVSEWLDFSACDWA